MTLSQSLYLDHQAKNQTIKSEHGNLPETYFFNVRSIHSSLLLIAA